MIVLEDLGNQQGWEKITPSASIGITASLIRPTTGKNAGLTAKAALIGVETNPIRIRMDGTAPTATNGLLLKADSYLTIINAENISNLLMIDDGATTAAVMVLLFF